MAELSLDEKREAERVKSVKAAAEADRAKEEARRAAREQAAKSEKNLLKS